MGSPRPLTRDPEPVHIEETDANFTIEWKGHYRIEGDAFIYVDRKTGATRAILGYPTQKLEHAAHGARGNRNFKYFWLGLRQSLCGREAWVTSLVSCYDIG